MQINIAYWVNEKYTKYAYYSILSLLNNVNKQNHINCYLITTKNNKYSKYIYNLENVYPFFKFYELVVNDWIKNIPTTLPHLDYSTFFRFSIDSLIKWVEKIIYIDADTIITNDISELYNIDLDWNIVGVISEWPEKSFLRNIERFSLLQKKYFNAWVMLIDIQKWKNFKVSKKCIELLKKNRYPCDDQDPLNIILQNNCKWIDWKYNVTSWYFMDNKENFCNIWFPEKFYLDAIKNPVIIHFTWSIKPWHLLSIHPFTNEYDNTVLKADKIENSEQIISIKEILIAYIHKFEFRIFPKYKTRKKIWNFLAHIKNKLYKIFNLIKNKKLIY